MPTPPHFSIGEIEPIRAKKLNGLENRVSDIEENGAGGTTLTIDGGNATANGASSMTINGGSA